MRFSLGRRKLFFIGIIIVIVLVGGLSILLLKRIPLKVSLKGEKPIPTSRENSEVISDFLNSQDEELKEIAGRAKEQLPPETSLDIIERKFRGGEFDVNKYLKLKTLAVFSPEKLPPDFQSDRFQRLQGDMLLEEMKEYQSQLDKKTKDLLSPFLILPDKEGSFFNPRTDREEILNKISQNL